MLRTEISRGIEGSVGNGHLYGIPSSCHRAIEFTCIGDPYSCASSVRTGAARRSSQDDRELGMLTFTVDEFCVKLTVVNHPHQFHHDSGVRTDRIGTDDLYFRKFCRLGCRSAAAQQFFLSHNIYSSFLEGFFQTNHTVREVKFRNSTQGLGGTFVDTDLAALAIPPVPFHFLFFLIKGPARIWAAHDTLETKSTLFTIKNWTDNPPVGGDEQLLRGHWSGRDRSEGHFPIFGDLYRRHSFLLLLNSSVLIESSLLSRPRNMRP